MTRLLPTGGAQTAPNDSLAMGCWRPAAALRMASRRVQAAVAASLLLVSGCGPSAYQRARNERTIESYLHLLDREPTSPHAAEVARWLDEARFANARRADRPFGYRRYLQLQPQGRFRAQATARLRVLALAAAKEPAQLELIVERYPGSPEAATSRQRLAEVYARRVLSMSDRTAARRFLSRFGDHPRASEVAAHLARLSFARLGNEIVEIERFVQEHAGTPSAELARKRLRAVWLREVDARPGAVAVARFARRFPNAPELPLLRRRSWDAALRRVLLAEPLGQWRALALKAYEMAGRRRLEGLIRACERRPAACAELRRLARAALPWRPAERLPELVAWSRGADPRREWEALAKLAWVDEAAAYEALIAAVGSSRLDRTWLALRSLRQSLQRGASGQLRRWLQRRYAKAVAGANPDRTQVRAAIDGLFGRREQALAELRRLRKHPAHATSASYLQVVFGRSEGPRLSALLAALRKRLGQLEQAFPGQLGPDNLGVARIAEQGLVMVERVFGDAAASAVEAVARHPLARRIARLLLAWRQKIRRIDAAFVSSSIPDYEIVASAHERQRGASFAALERARGPLARALLLAVCAVHEAGAMQARRPGCPAQVKASGPKR